jgi:hypothetical protein
VTVSFDRSIRSTPTDAIDLTRDSQVNKDPCVRLYTSAPGVATLQIRSFGQTTQRRGGARKHIVSNAALTANDAKKLMALLETFIIGEG